MMLAQISPDSLPGIGIWLVCASATLFLLNQALTFYKEHIREQPTPANTYATKDEHRGLEQRMDAELGRERGSRKKMHEEIAALQADTQSIKTETQAQTRDIADLKQQNNALNDRIDEIPMRTIKLLNETKQLHG